MIKNKYPDTKPSLNLDFVNSKTLDARITFTRDAPGRYYDGKTQHVTSQNFVEYSQNFESGYWVKSNINVVHNTTTAPDGTDTACLVYNHDTNEYGGSGNMYINSQFGVRDDSLTHDTYTYSIYAKRAGRDYLFISLFDHNTDYTNTAGHVGGQQGQYVFDLRTGTIVDHSMDPNNTSVASIESVGDDWYRCIITAKGATTRCWLYSVNSEFNLKEPNVAGETNGVYLWGAQAEKRDRCTPYTPTDGAMITRHTPTLVTAASDQPRFDHDPITSKPLGLLIEERVENMLIHSDNPAMDSSVWYTQYQGLFTVPTVSIAPDGSYANKAVAATGNGEVDNHHQLYQMIDGIQGDLTYTFSVYAKAAELKTILLAETSKTGSSVTFNLGTGEVLAKNSGNDGNKLNSSNGFLESVKMQPVGDGWYRCSYTILPSAEIVADSDSFGYSIYLVGDDGSPFVGDDVSGVYLWGAQAERMPFATSYISNREHRITRQPDVATISEYDFDWYNPTQGTMLAEASDIDIGVNDRDDATNSTQRHCIFAFNTEPSKSYNFIGIGKTLSGGYNDMLTISSYSDQQLLTYYDSIKVSNAVAPGVAYKTGLSYINNKLTGVYNGTIHTSEGESNYSGVGAKSSDSENDLMDLTSRINRLGIGQRQNRNDNNLNGHIKRLTYYPTCLTDQQLQTLTS